MKFVYRDVDGFPVYEHGVKTYKHTGNGWWYRRVGPNWVAIKDPSEIPQLPKPKKKSPSWGWIGLSIFALYVINTGWETALWQLVAVGVFLQVFLRACGYFLMTVWVALTRQDMRIGATPVAYRYPQSTQSTSSTQSN